MSKRREKIKWFTIIPSSYNRIELGDSNLEVSYRLKLLDQKKDEIKDFGLIKQGEFQGKLCIIISKKRGKEDNDNLEQVKYHLNNTGFGVEKNEINVREANIGNLNNVIAEAHRKFILSHPVKDQLIPGTNITFSIIESPNKLGIISLKKENETSSFILTDKDLSEIDLEFYSSKKVSIFDTVNILPENKNFWSKHKKKTIFFTILLIFVVLGIIFWKRISNWFRNRKSEKTSQNSLDIL